MSVFLIKLSSLNLTGSRPASHPSWLVLCMFILFYKLLIYFGGCFWLSGYQKSITTCLPFLFLPAKRQTRFVLVAKLKEIKGKINCSAKGGENALLPLFLPGLLVTFSILRSKPSIFLPSRLISSVIPSRRLIDHCACTRKKRRVRRCDGGSHFRCEARARPLPPLPPVITKDYMQALEAYLVVSSVAL